MHISTCIYLSLIFVCFLQIDAWSFSIPGSFPSPHHLIPFCSTSGFGAAGGATLQPRFYLLGLTAGRGNAHAWAMLWHVVYILPGGRLIFWPLEGALCQPAASSSLLRLYLQNRARCVMAPTPHVTARAAFCHARVTSRRQPDGEDRTVLSERRGGHTAPAIMEALASRCPVDVWGGWGMGGWGVVGWAPATWAQRFPGLSCGYGRWGGAQLVESITPIQRAGPYINSQSHGYGL